ncbi:MAG TPA: Calx-beta domain-containing protein [Verrucomicrobiae bacterium]|nr:Calx-beta domain-containing protein [Verrucomicrobiae bacterium]
MLVPQPGLRDTDGLDFGYHYDPVDYAFHGVTIRNAKITVQPGTVIGTFAVSGINSSGLIVADGATFDSQGKPNDSNWIVSFDTISDNPTATWQPAENSVATSFSGIDLPPTIFCRFTSWSIIDQGSAHFNAATSAGNISFQDNEFHGGDFITSLPTISLKNCLFERVDATIASTDSGAPYIRNCLFFGGTFDFEPNVSTSVVKDNLFDQTIIPDNSATYASYDGGYNAYVTATSDHLQPEFPSTDKVLTAAPVYVAGPLGFYYQPVNNNSLLDADLSTTAASVGLYHYAVTATPVGGQSKEGNSSLDIGYHYVTVDANGNPLDANLDSIPDYSEDVDGDGTPDPGELPWLPLVKITASDSFASQAGSLGEFSIDLPAAAGAGGVNVSYNLDGTALNGTDYELISSSSITVPAGSSTAKIVIKPKTDVLFSGTKTVRLTLTAATGYSSGQIDSTIAIVNIFGNAQPSGVFPYAGHPTISLSVSDDDARENTIVSEATRNGEFTITRTDSSTDPDDLKADLQVRFAVTGTATAGIDYQTIESVIIPANQTSVTVKVIPIDDAIVETAETVILTLLPSPKYELATPNSGTVVIDDKTTAASLITYTVKVVDPIAIESPSSGGYADSAAFEITRTGSILNGKNIDYKIQESGDPGPMQFEFPGGFPGAATLGVDFDPSQGYQGGRNYYPKAISFAAGQWIKKIKITPSTNSRTGDDGVETPETVRLSIIDTITAVTTSGDALIYDHHYDNVPPITIPVAPSLVRLSSSDTKAIESPANAASFQIIRRGAKAGPMYVKFRIDGTVDPSDYQISSANTLTQIAPTVWEGKIAAGNSSTTLTVTPTIDGVAEGVESMIISLVDSGDYQTDTDRQIALRILDSSTTPDIIPDTDRDGINDLDELSATLPTDPLDSDSDGDGIPDGYFANASSDTNEDGISNTAELILRLFATDSDGDGITDFREINRGTDPISGTFSADVTAPTITLTSPTSPKVTALP